MSKPPQHDEHDRPLVSEQQTPDTARARLRSYLQRSAGAAAAGLGAFGLAAEPAQAAIIGVDPTDFDLTGANFGWANVDGIDIDGNGTPDVGFFRGYYYYGYLVARDETERVGQGSYPYYPYGGGQVTLLYNPNNADQGYGYCCNNGEPLQAFKEGEVIGDDETADSPSNSILRASYSLGDFDHVSETIDDGLTPAYIGFEITGLSTGTGSGFGWIEVIVEDPESGGIGTNALNMLVTRWAYTDDGTPITAGDFGPPLALPGDANGDGKVDLLDLDILGSEFGLTDPPNTLQSDFNGDGTVDLLDLDILGTNFGAMAMPSSAVPEPTAGGLSMLAALALGAGGLAQRRRDEES